MTTGLLFGVFAIAVAAGGWLLLRHWVLAAIASLVPASVCFAALFTPWPSDAFPLLLCAGFITCGALLTADEIVLRLCAGEPKRVAARAALRDSVPRWGGLALVTLVIGWAGGPATPIALAAGTLLALVMLRLSYLLPFGEDWLSRTCRFRDWAEQASGHIVALARPRYGFSVVGIGLVLAVLAVFSAKPFLLAASADLLGILPFPATALISMIAVQAIVLRDTRTIAASVLAAVPVVAVTVWFCGRFGGYAVSNIAASGIGVIAGQLLALSTASVIARHVAEGDDATMAGARMLSRHLVGVVGTTCAVVLGFIAVAPLTGALVVIAIGAVAIGCASAVLFQPALLVVIETLFPRRATIEARYRLD